MIIKPADINFSDSNKILSNQYDDIYFQPENGIEEANYVFIQQNNLEKRFKELSGNEKFNIGEFGFGTGLNCILAINLFKKTANKDSRLNIISFEKHPILKEDLTKIYDDLEYKEITNKILSQYPKILPGIHHIQFENINLYLYFGDVKDYLSGLKKKIDAWFLDGFAPAKNPDMWSEQLLLEIGRKSNKKSSFSTFTAARAVKDSMERSGFEITKIKGFGKKRNMLIGVKTETGKDIIPRDKIFFHTENDKKENKTVSIIGAGIAGCSIAYSLAKRGYKVTIIDKNNSEASEASGNLLASYYPKLTSDMTDMSLFYQHSFLYLLKLLPELKLNNWYKSGLISLAIDENEEKRQQKATSLYPNDYVEYLDKKNLSKIAGIDLKYSGLYFKNAGYLSPTELCNKLIDHNNITKIFDTDIDNIEKNTDKWHAVSRETIITKSDIIICANASSINKFEQTKFLPLESVRGQVNYLNSNKDLDSLKTVICHKGYIIPKFNNKNLIGATFTRDGEFNYDIRQKDTEKNISELNKYIPSIKANNTDDLDGRTGYRCFTPDRLPAVGKCPDYNWFLKNYADIKHGKKHIDYPKPEYLDGLYINTAFGSHGITTAPLAAEILANIINDEHWIFPYKSYQSLNPSRFIIRDLKSS